MPKKKNDTAPAQGSLLDRALGIETTRAKHGRYTEDECALAEAWVDDRVTITQVTGVVTGGNSGNGAYSFLARCLKQIRQDEKAARK